MSNLIERKYIIGFVVFLVALIGILFFLNSVDPSNDNKGLGDAPVGVRHEAPRDVWLSPDNFMNIVAYCIGVNGVYVHTRPAEPIVIVNDLNCAPGGILYDPQGDPTAIASGAAEG